MERKFIKEIMPQLHLYQYNEIPVLSLEHEVGSALIALQGAHLFSWQPNHATEDVLWCSEIESFKLGTAIRGGIPLCFPWFNNAGTPAHGFARISIWQLIDYAISKEKVRLDFGLFSDDNVIIAKLQMCFDEQCELIFTNYSEENAQLALHSYFNVADIQQTQLHNLPTETFNSLTQQSENVPSPRYIAENVDCIYTANELNTIIQDDVLQRKIEISHQNASDIVVWNPWHKATSSMSATGYLKMLCVETARIQNKLSKGEKMGVILSITPNTK